jgi:hypothetical protein
MVPGTAKCCGQVCTLRGAHINDFAIAVLKTNSLLVFSSLPHKQQTSFIMPINGVLQSVHDTDYVLATRKGGVHVRVEVQSFNQTDNQRVSRHPEMKF